MMGFFKHIKEIFNVFTQQERRKLYIVIIIAIFMALIEVIGVGSIMPFMTVATKPEMIHKNEILSAVFNYLGFKSDKSFLLFLGIGVLTFLILTNIANASMSYIKTRFGSMRQYSISSRIMEGYLSMDYPFFLNRNSFDFVKTITTEVQQFITGSVMQLVDFIARLIQTILLLTFLFFVNPLTTLCLTLGIAIIYGSVYFLARKALNQLGQLRVEKIGERAKIVSEAFWGIKEVKLTGTEKVFLNSYQGPSRTLAIAQSKSEIIGDLPKFALESIAFSSIMIFVMLAMLTSGDFSEIAGSVTLFAYAGYRLIPAVQGLFKTMTKIRYGVATTNRLKEEISLFNKDFKRSSRAMEPLSFTKKLEIRDIIFTYPKSESPVIKGITIDIFANQMIGFAGTTGSGKTTMVDIILGLLKPDSGFLYADGIQIDEGNRESWQMNLGYVPQNIYLSDNTLYENIAFGVPIKKIDFTQVEKAAKMAQIHDFVESSLPEKYFTKVGERGIRLSGGQRQRIGIARALYRNPSVLVMDEATSALDNQTEKAVMEAIDSLQGTRTIVLIAHRLSTLKKCDKIFLLENGNLVTSGTYEQLNAQHEYFQNKQ